MKEEKRYEVVLSEDAKKFVGSLREKMRAKVYRAVEMLKVRGFHLKSPHSKSLKGEDNLYELRVKQGSDIIRLFYFFAGDKTYIVTSGYVKKDEKANAREIEKARRIKEDMKWSS